MEIDAAEKISLKSIRAKMEKEQADDRIVLRFNEAKYKEDLDLYNSKEKYRDGLVFELRKLLDEEFVPKEIPEYAYENMVNFFYEILKKHGGFPPIMTGERISVMLGMKTNRLAKMQQYHDDVVAMQKPNIEDYKIYIETDQEYEKLIFCNKILQVTIEVEEKNKDQRRKWGEVFSPYLSFDIRTGNYEINEQYIKDSTKK